MVLVRGMDYHWPRWWLTVALLFDPAETYSKPSLLLVYQVPELFPAGPALCIPHLGFAMLSLLWGYFKNQNKLFAVTTT